MGVRLVTLRLQVLRALETAGAIELSRGRIDVVDRAVLARHTG